MAAVHCVIFELQVYIFNFKPLPLLICVAVMLAICSLMMSPNADNPAVQEIADVYLNDRAKFDETARAWTLEHAKPDV